MLRNPRDAFRVQSRSPNIIIVSFHMLGKLSSCTILTLTLRVFLLFDVQKCCDLEIGVRGHSRSLRVVSFDRFLL